MVVLFFKITISRQAALPVHQHISQSFNTYFSFMLLLSQNTHTQLCIQQHIYSSFNSLLTQERDDDDDDDDDDVAAAAAAVMIATTNNQQPTAKAKS